MLENSLNKIKVKSLKIFNSPTGKLMHVLKKREKKKQIYVKLDARRYLLVIDYIHYMKKQVMLMLSINVIQEQYGIVL